MTLGNRLKTFFAGPRTKRKRKSDSATRCVCNITSMTDVRNIEENELCYQSFDSCSIPSPLPTVSPSSSSSYVGLFDEVLHGSSTMVSEDNCPISKRSHKKSLRFLFCGLQPSDKCLQNETAPESTRKMLIDRQITEADKEQTSVQKMSKSSDSGLSCSSMDRISQMGLDRENEKPNTIDQLRSCDLIPDALHTELESCGRLSSSTSSLFRLTSIQENALKISHRRHKKIRQKQTWSMSQGFEDPNIDDEGKLDESLKKTVRFLDTTNDSERKSISMIEIYRNNSIQLKAWEIRRRRRNQKEREKHQSRSLDHLNNRDTAILETP